VGATFAASAQIFDALGQSHVVTINYTKTAANAWSYSMSVPGADVAGGTPGTPTVINSGAVTFSGLGVLTAPAADVVVTSPAWANGATATNFSWDLVNAGTTPALTGFASPSATSSVTQNGQATAASLTQVTITGSGEIVASFGVGQSVTIAQLAVATFNNPQGLVKLGTNLYSQSEASGVPSVGTAGSGGRGTIIGGALEQSNVDIAQEFTQMILAQRGYQANSRSITVADELLLETLNIKR
jgi:flagellar hook protein FlgE